MLAKPLATFMIIAGLGLSTLPALAQSEAEAPMANGSGDAGFDFGWLGLLGLAGLAGLTGRKRSGTTYTR